MNRLSSILLIQACVVTPAFAATVIQPAQSQTSTTLAMAHDPVPVQPEIKIAKSLQLSQPQSQFQPKKKNISTAKPVKPNTISSMASGTAAYYRRRLRAQHHHTIQSQPQFQSKFKFQSAKPFQASKKQETTPLTGRIVHQEEVLQATTLPPTVAPRQVSPVAEPVPPTRQNQADNGFGTWLKQLAHQLTHHKAKPNTTDSDVSGITEAQSAQLARSISAYVCELLPNSTYLLLAPPQKQKHNLLTQALNDTLRQAGFRLVQSKTDAQDAQVLQYQVSQLNDGVWLKVQLNKKEANRFYALNADESLAEDAPFCVREGK